MSIIQELHSAVIAGQVPTVKNLIKQGLDKGEKIEDILNQGLIAAMDQLGKQFEKKEVFLPELMLAARAMTGGMEILEPLLAGAGVEPVGKVAIGTVKGDIHNIGKNLVGVMLKGAGFEVIDLGIDVSPEKFVEIGVEGVTLVGLSALTGTTMPMMKTTIEAMANAGLKGKVKIMVGGALITQAFADKIGADGYAPDASSAVAKAKELLGIKK